jgi:hypothetical protein
VAERETLERRARATVPMLVAEGALDAATGARFERGPLVVKGSRVSLFTGLFVEAPPGVVLRVSSSANRRARSFVVRERVVRPSEGLVPLVLELEVSKVDGPVVLEGELATVIPLVERWRGEVTPLERDLDAARAHVRFYDRAYFDSKKRGPTRKYRALVRRAGAVPAREAVRVVEAGPTLARARARSAAAALGARPSRDLRRQQRDGRARSRRAGAARARHPRRVGARAARPPRRRRPVRGRAALPHQVRDTPTPRASRTSS